MGEISYNKRTYFSSNLRTIHKGWSIWTARQFRFKHPDIVVGLYDAHGRFLLHVRDAHDRFQELCKEFDLSIRPATCPIDLVEDVPSSAVQIDTSDNYLDELWGCGEPVPVPVLNDLLSLTRSDLPNGLLDFDTVSDHWVFRSTKCLSAEDKKHVEEGGRLLGIRETIQFFENVPPLSGAVVVERKISPTNVLDLTSARRVPASSGSLKAIIQKDEDEWRDFLKLRADQKIMPQGDDKQPTCFSCLFDTVDKSEIRISELLMLYDRIDIMPDKDGLEWLEKHNLTLENVQQLIRLKKLRLILPFSANHYPQKLLEAANDADPQSLILSRALASKTIVRGQNKDPLIYAPLNSNQRAAIFSVLMKTNTNEKFRAVLSKYGEIFQQQNYTYMLRGAMANLTCGIGAYLGNAFFVLRNQDARIELETNGAAIEWALGLGASYIPRNFGGFDETANSLLIASFMGKTRAVPADPVTNRMHTVVDGLLSVSGVPPLEIAVNFSSLAVNRFRTVAEQMMRGATETTELATIVAEMNSDVQRFERRTERLAKWKLDTLLGGAVSGVVGNQIDAHLGAGASVAGAWLYEMLKDKIPSEMRREFADAGSILLGLATGSSIDTVIVSRSRKRLS